MNVFEGARRIAKLVALIGVLVYGIAVFTNSPYVPVWYAVNWPGETPVLLKELRCADSVTESRDGVPTRSGKEISLTMCFVKQVASDGSKLVFYEKMPLEEFKIEEQRELTIEQKRALANAKVRLGLQEKSSTGSSSAIDLSRIPTEELLAMRRRLAELETKAKGKNRYWGNESYSPEVSEYTKRTINAFVIPPTDEDWIERQWWSKRLKGIWEATLGLLGGLAFLWGLSWAVGWIVRGFMGIPRGHDRRPDAQ